MKQLTILFATVPGLAFAHGGHMPVPEAAHAMAHTGPVLGVVAIAAAIGLFLLQRWRS